MAAVTRDEAATIIDYLEDMAKKAMRATTDRMMVVHQANLLREFIAPPPEPRSAHEEQEVSNATDTGVSANAGGTHPVENTSEVTPTGSARAAIRALLQQFRLRAVTYANRASSVRGPLRHASQGRAIEAHLCADDLEPLLDQLHREAEASDAALLALQQDADLVRHGCIIEIAVRNQSVSDYMTHWEGRALKAEAQVLALQQERDRPTRKACVCREPDPVMQADMKFYCHACSYETGARPSCLEPERVWAENMELRSKLAALRPAAETPPDGTKA